MESGGRQDKAEAGRKLRARHPQVGPSPLEELDTQARAPKEEDQGTIRGHGARAEAHS